jgi:DNA-binding FrmR family transcriptional regulator
VQQEMNQPPATVSAGSTFHECAGIIPLASRAGCADVLQVIASVRGAVNGLMAEVIEDHVRCHVGAPSLAARERAGAVDELIEVVNAYLK